MLTLTLYYREGCHLCEDMQAQLAELFVAGSFELQRVDIDEEPQLQQRYNELVPVLKHGSTELCHHFLDMKAVSSLLAGYNSGTDQQ